MSSTLKRKAASSVDASKKIKTGGGNASITSFFGAPKIVSSSTNGSSAPRVESPAPTFDKDKWVASLKDEQRELLQLEIDTLDESWLAHLKDEVTSKEFLDLKKFLAREMAGSKKIFPPPQDIYSWSRLTPFNSVKCVILGQDPYHNVNQAHGLAFSVRPPTPPPPSLRNMFIALKKDYPSFQPPPNKNGLLTPWAERGVLMLNTCLTVRAHEANSHANHGWEKFTQRVIDLVAQKRTRGVVFLAWGTPAGKRVVKVDKKRHLVLQSVHPSPLSASRGFFDCGHFRKTNEWLVTRYGEGSEIDWNLVPKEEEKKKEEEDKDKDQKKKKQDDEKASAAAAASAKKEEPTPVVTVGKVEQKNGNGAVEEKSKLLEDEGEEGAVETNGEKLDASSGQSFSMSKLTF
ncbi:uracil DNA glycosylase [Neopestalotiopsis sp. 37M]|nr:uracil DNA glycosylase [Neopestalotiopsis sp. 37M]